MPKGVEHTKVTVRGRNGYDVIYPLMPKGVEHLAKHNAEENRKNKVIYPLMPKGVEHSFGAIRSTLPPM